MATGWNGRFFNAEVGENAPIANKYGMVKVLTMNISHLLKVDQMKQMLKKL